MTRYDIGDVIRLTATFSNAAGVPTNPTTVVLTVRKPDGTQATPIATSDGAGVYHVDVAIDQADVWWCRWVATGTVTSAEQCQFSVRRQRVTA